MPRAILIIIVVILLLGALPTWPYSAGLGYYPSGRARVDFVDFADFGFGEETLIVGVSARRRKAGPNCGRAKPVLPYKG